MQQYLVNASFLCFKNFYMACSNQTYWHREINQAIRHSKTKCEGVVPLFYNVNLFVCKHTQCAMVLITFAWLVLQRLSCLLILLTIYLGLYSNTVLFYYT